MVTIEDATERAQEIAGQLFLIEEEFTSFVYGLETMQISPKDYDDTEEAVRVAAQMLRCARDAARNIVEAKRELDTIWSGALHERTRK